MTKASRHFVLLSSYFFLSDCRVPPGECGFTSSDGDPGTNGVITKLAVEREIKARSAILQADSCGIGIRPMRHALEANATSPLDYVIRQLVRVSRCSGKMRSQQLPDLLDAFNDRAAKLLA